MEGNQVVLVSGGTSSNPLAGPSDTPSCEPPKTGLRCGDRAALEHSETLRARMIAAAAEAIADGSAPRLVKSRS